MPLVFQGPASFAFTSMNYLLRVAFFEFRVDMFYLSTVVALDRFSISSSGSFHLEIILILRLCHCLYSILLNFLWIGILVGIDGLW